MYSFYEINPFAASVDEKYDDKKDLDLLMLCRDIPDVVFLVFNLPQTGISMYLRVPEESKGKVDAIESFGTREDDNYITTQIQSLVNLKLAKSFIYPLINDDVESDIFSYIKDAPYGIFGIKLNHNSSKKIISKYKSLLRKKDEDGICVDPYEKLAKQKFECTVFFRAEIFFGVKQIDKIDLFAKAIPHTVKHSVNYLKQKNKTSISEKNQDRATTTLKKILSSNCKGKNMILSDQEISQFIRFPKNPQTIGLDSAKTPTMATTSFDEKVFDKINSIGNET